MSEHELPIAQPTPGPGWLLDPDNPTMERWWDGTDWTDQRRIPSPAGAVQQAPPATRDPNKVLPAEIVATILLPLVGFILAIVSFVRGESYRGGNLLGLTFLVVLGWYILLTAMGS